MTNFIEIYDDALSPDECTTIIDYFESSNKKEKGGILAHGSITEDKNVKDSTDVYCLFSDETKLTYTIADVLVPAINKYIEKYEDSWKIAPWGLQNNFNLQRYHPGQGYKAIHCEHFTKQDATVLAWMFYLNTVEDGGTLFTSYNLTTNCVQGRLVLWPAYWTHCHRGVTSETKTKYIATGWTCFK